MPTPVIVGAARTAIGRSFKGTLVNTPPETLITTVLPEVIRRSGVDPADIDTLQDLIVGALNDLDAKREALAAEKLGPLSSGLGGLPGLG